MAHPTHTAIGTWSGGRFMHFGEPLDDEAVAVMRRLASPVAGDPAIVRRFAEVVFLSDIRAELARVQTSVLIMQCADDAVAPLTAGDYLQRHLPRARLVRLAATGHCPHLSHPEETTSQICAELNRPVVAAAA